MSEVKDNSWFDRIRDLLGDSPKDKKDLISLLTTAANDDLISQDSYQVSLDFYLQFILENPSNRQFFESEIKKDKFRFSLKKYIKYKLNNFGIQDISSIPIDTFKQDHICFSYRKSIKKKENDYGRMISTIVIKD